MSTFMEHSSPPDFCPQAESLKDGKEHIAEVHEPRLGGDFIVSVSPLLNEGKIVGSVHVARNTTELKQLQVKLEEHARNLETLVGERTKALKEAEWLAAIGATAGMVGHDIRNPLQAITGDLFLLKQDAQALPAVEVKQAMCESIDAIDENIAYINKIVSDLQNYTKPLKPNIEKVNLKELFRSMLIMANISHAVTLEVNVDDELTVKSDFDYLLRALTNLAINAKQAMPNGGKLTLTVAKKGDKTLITVEDNGVGISEEVKTKLFTPLFTTKSKGQGLGLAVVKRLIESLNGKITFESVEGKGTKFIIELP